MNLFYNHSKINSEINHDKVTEAKMSSLNQINITVCMGSACFARGNAENLAFIEKFIKENGLNAQIDLCGSRCENKCAEGPNIIINDKTYKEVDIEKLTTILNKLFLD